MVSTFFIRADSQTGAPPTMVSNAALQVCGLSTAEIYAWEPALTGFGEFKLLTTDNPGEEAKYSADMVDLLLRLKARGPVAKFKNSREALERLLPSK